MGRTSISCSNEAKAAAEDIKREEETWDACLMWLAERVGEPSDSDAVLERLDALEEALERTEPTRERSRSGGTTVDVDVIREAVHEEARNQMRALLR